MTPLHEQYDRQRRWRDFDTVYARLGPLAGLRVADAGCGSGTVSADLAARGADVVGIDTDAALLAHAARQVPAATFRKATLETPGLWGADGFDLVWCSFAMAYLSEPVSVLRTWRTILGRDARMVLIEIADLFAHAPLGPEDRAALAAFERMTRTEGSYRFDAGHHLGSWATEAGYVVVEDFDLQDGELCAQGPCSDDVRQAWANRIDRMPRLQAIVAPGFKDRFLACLEQTGHISGTRVRCVIARAA
ncbi:MAG: methyltransferase domain-containing protein [Maritimibacter sp.]|nr:methyltransferase domain-containing protein [Maritimibacter sp.]